MYLILFNVINVVSVLLSIGISDMIEYILSPDVHKFHNCPHIMGMSWDTYNAWYAFVSGIKCAWFLLLPLCVFNIHTTLCIVLIIININIPIVCYITGYDQKDMYLAHKLLYVVNPCFLLIAVCIKFIY